VITSVERWCLVKWKILTPSIISEYYPIRIITYPEKYQRQCVHIDGPHGTDYVRIFVTIGAILVIALCARLCITQQGNNVVQHCALASDATLVRISDEYYPICILMYPEKYQRQCVQPEWRKTTTPQRGWKHYTKFVSCPTTTEVVKVSAVSVPPP